MADEWGLIEQRLVVFELSVRCAIDAAEGQKRLYKKAQEKLETEAVRALSGKVTGMSSQFDPAGFFVYCLWGFDGDCLYVGQSANVLARLGSHLGNGDKFCRVANVSLLRCADRQAMDGAEMRLIRKYQPPWNTIGVGNPLP